MLRLTDDRKTFDFELGGVEYSVTTLDSIPYDLSKELRDVKTDAEAIAWIADRIFEREAPEAMRKLTTGQWKSVVQAYLDASEASPGESQA